MKGSRVPLQAMSPSRMGFFRYNVGAMKEGIAAKRQPMNTRNRNVLKMLVSLAAAGISGRVFILALFQQFALVEVAASILTGVQVFFLSSAIADLLDKEREPSGVRTSVVVLFTIFLVAFYCSTRYLHWASGHLK